MVVNIWSVSVSCPYSVSFEEHHADTTETRWFSTLQKMLNPTKYGILQILLICKFSIPIYWPIFFFLRGTYLHNICCVLFIYSFMLCPTLLGSVVLVAFQRFYQRCSLSSQGWTNYAMLTLITWVIGVYPIPFFLKFHLLDDINADGDWLDQLVRL